MESVHGNRLLSDMLIYSKAVRFARDGNESNRADELLKVREYSAADHALVMMYPNMRRVRSHLPGSSENTGTLEGTIE